MRVFELTQYLLVIAVLFACGSAVIACCFCVVRWLHSGRVVVAVVVVFVCRWFLLIFCLVVVVVAIVGSCCLQLFGVSCGRYRCHCFCRWCSSW
jgi:hypothetical protein